MFSLLWQWSSTLVLWTPPVYAGFYYSYLLYVNIFIYTLPFKSLGSLRNGCNGLPAQSPDLNPIELLWEQLDRMVRKKCPSSQSNLWEVLQEAWGEISSDYLNKLTARMPKVCKAVIAANGEFYIYLYILCMCLFVCCSMWTPGRVAGTICNS